MNFPEGALKLILRALLSFFLLLILGACGAHEKPADLRIVNGKEPESLDPAVITGQPDLRAVQSIFEGLTRYNAETAAAEPGLSDHWTISEDAKIYTFHIRTNALWSNGEPIKAQDFLYSWIRVLKPETASDYSGILYYIKNAEDFNNGKITNSNEVGIKALDDRTFRVELLNPTAFFLDLCAFGPLAVVHRGTIEKYGDRWLNTRPLPVSGAYQLISWRLNDKIRLKANPYYWNAANTGCDVVDLYPVNSSSTALNLFLTKAVDIVWDKEVIPTELLDVLRERKDFHTFDYLADYFYRYNVTRKPFDDVRVRKALALAIDKKRITEKITKGGERPADFLVPPIPGYKSPPGLGYDPELARKLLAEAGYPEGKGFPRFNYLFNTARDHEKIAVELQDMWQKELGISVELRSVEWKVYLRMQSNLEYDLSRSSWVGDYTDPNTFLDMFMSNNPNNRTGWKNEKYDELIHAANSTADLAKRAEYFQQAEAILIHEELPVVPLYIYVGMNFFDPDLITGIYNNIRDEHPTRAIRKRGVSK